MLRKGSVAHSSATCHSHDIPSPDSDVAHYYSFRQSFGIGNFQMDLSLTSPSDHQSRYTKYQLMKLLPDPMPFANDFTLHILLVLTGSHFVVAPSLKDSHGSAQPSDERGKEKAQLPFPKQYLPFHFSCVFCFSVFLRRSTSTSDYRVLEKLEEEM